MSVNLVSPLNQNRRVLSTLILLLFISAISAIRSMDFRHPGTSGKLRRQYGTVYKRPGFLKWTRFSAFHKIIRMAKVN